MLTVKYRTHDGGWRIVEAKGVETRPTGGDGAQLVSAKLADDSFEHTVVCRVVLDEDQASVCAAKAYIENMAGKTTQIIEPGR